MNNPSSSTSASATAPRKPSPFKLYFILAVLLLAAFAVMIVTMLVNAGVSRYEARRGRSLGERLTKKRSAWWGNG